MEWSVNMKTIAIIDDDIPIGDMLEEILRKEGHGVLRAYSGTEAMYLLSRRRPDLVLLDLNLPEVSGFQICRDIKRRSALPVLVLTSRDQLRDEVHALELGADEYLTKP